MDAMRSDTISGPVPAVDRTRTPDRSRRLAVGAVAILFAALLSLAAAPLAGGILGSNVGGIVLAYALAIGVPFAVLVVAVLTVGHLLDLA